LSDNKIFEIKFVVKKMSLAFGFFILFFYLSLAKMSLQIAEIFWWSRNLFLISNKSLSCNLSDLISSIISSYLQSFKKSWQMISITSELSLWVL